MRCRTTVTIRATTAKPTQAQNSHQIWKTTAIPPTTNATSPMTEPTQAARVRPWCTCLPRLLVGPVTCECCAVPAMAPSFPPIGICIPSTYRRRPAIRRSAGGRDALRCHPLWRLGPDHAHRGTAPRPCRDQQCYSLLAHRAVNPPPSWSLAKEERLRSLPLRAPAHDLRRSHPCCSLLAHRAVNPRSDRPPHPGPSTAPLDPRRRQPLPCWARIGNGRNVLPKFRP